MAWQQPYPGGGGPGGRGGYGGQPAPPPGRGRAGGGPPDWAGQTPGSQPGYGRGRGGGFQYDDGSGFDPPPAARGGPAAGATSPGNGSDSGGGSWKGSRNTPPDPFASRGPPPVHGGYRGIPPTRPPLGPRPPPPPGPGYGGYGGYPPDPYGRYPHHPPPPPPHYGGQYGGDPYGHYRPPYGGHYGHPDPYRQHPAYHHPGPHQSPPDEYYHQDGYGARSHPPPPPADVSNYLYRRPTEGEAPPPPPPPEEDSRKAPSPPPSSKKKRSPSPPSPPPQRREKRREPEKPRETVDVSEKDPVDSTLLGRNIYEDDDPDLKAARRAALDALSRSERMKLIDNNIKIRDGSGPQAFKCEACHVSLSSLRVILGHIESESHKDKQAYRQLKMQPIEVEELVQKFAPPVGRPKGLKELLDNKPPHVQVIGLKYVTEYTDEDDARDPVFSCELCDAVLTKNTVIAHLSGYSHFTNFMAAAGDPDAQKYSERNHVSEGLLKNNAHKIVARWRPKNGAEKEWETSHDFPAFAQSSTVECHQEELARQDQFIYSHMIKAKISCDDDQAEVMRIITQITCRLIEYKMDKAIDKKKINEITNMIREEANPARFRMKE